jgi:hypothetical protein
MGSLALSLALLCGVLPATASAIRSGPETSGPIPPLSASGRWFTDAAGRVVMLHGFNEVSKAAPFHPAAFGFGDDDAAFLEGLGFNAVRLGVVMEGLIPAPGQIDHGYVDHIADTVDTLARHHLFVLLDSHCHHVRPRHEDLGVLVHAAAAGAARSAREGDGDRDPGATLPGRLHGARPGRVGRPRDPCATRLVLRTKPHATDVSVRVTPRSPGSGGRACRAALSAGR